MQLAYDDFGAGQARLDELARVAPDCVKFDMRLIRDLDQAPAERRIVTERLVALVRELGSVPLAEGVESQAEAEACAQIGFELAQGYYFGRPAPLP
jgi:EAL domain-containing protein (putative c-di-GMP-specific phosphodiesterase class I)